MFSLNGTLKKSGTVGRWETKQFIGMALRFGSVIAKDKTKQLTLVLLNPIFKTQERPNF